MLLGILTENVRETYTKMYGLHNLCMYNMNKSTPEELRIRLPYILS